jgi:uncharacterized protein (DUF427 family)
MTDSPHLVITPTDTHVVVRIAGQVVADSRRPVVVEEKGCPVRYYLPREDVRAEWLRPTDRHTTCPYKGEASYFSLEVAGTMLDNVVWTYSTPIETAALITGLLCFYQERVELVVDGAPVR